MLRTHSALTVFVFRAPDASTNSRDIFRSARIEFSIVQDYGLLSLTTSYFAFDGSKTDALGDAFADEFADALGMH